MSTAVVGGQSNGNTRTANRRTRCKTSRGGGTGHERGAGGALTLSPPGALLQRGCVVIIARRNKKTDLIFFGGFFSAPRRCLRYLKAWAGAPAFALQSLPSSSTSLDSKSAKVELQINIDVPPYRLKDFRNPLLVPQNNPFKDGGVVNRVSSSRWEGGKEGRCLMCSLSLSLSLSPLSSLNDDVCIRSRGLPFNTSEQERRDAAGQLRYLGNGTAAARCHSSARTFE